jgi:hypothetical protein
MTDLPYETEAPYARRWTEKAFEMLQAGALSAQARVRREVATLIVNGSCPRCAHHLHQDFVETLVAPAPTEQIMTVVISEDNDDDLNFSTRDVTCNCSEVHEGRPTGSEGCGITFRVSVRRKVAF